MGELKASLKAAKTAIKEKDYEAAIIHCKDVLSIDGKNYQALVMLGKVLQEGKQYIESKHALLLATKVDETNRTAWKGLYTLLEKDGSVFAKDEEVETLIHLKQITDDEEKLEAIVHRLANVYQKYDCLPDALSVLESYAHSPITAERKLQVYRCIINILQGIAYPSNELHSKLIDSYEAVLNDSPLKENENFFKAYLTLIYQNQNYTKLMSAAERMFATFPVAYPLEWIARAFVEVSYLTPDSSLLSDVSLEHYIEKLLALWADSVWGNLAKALLCCKEKEEENASQLVGSDMISWLTLIDCQVQLQDFAGVESTCRKFLNLLNTNSLVQPLPPTFHSFEELGQMVLLKQATALIQMGHINHLQEAIHLLQQIPNKDLETNIMYIKALLGIKDIERASSVLQSIDDNSPSLKVVAASVAKASGNIQLAMKIHEEILQSHPDNAIALFEVGRIYFEKKDYQTSVLHLMRAASQDSKFSLPILYLGHYNKLLGNLDRAKRCYETAFQLNPDDEETGVALSDFYRLTVKHELNLALLERVTSNAGCHGNGWAWFRLGLHHLTQKSFDKAIQSLQHVVQVNPSDRIGYECLGDAYLARGSYTAALKVFRQAIQLDPDASIYSRCKMAYMNYLLWEFNASVAEYELILAKVPPASVKTVALVELAKVPPASVKTVALVELAEVLLSRARKFHQHSLFSNLRDDCLYAIRCLTSAAEHHGSCVTIWKMLGDACSMIAVVPESLSAFTVPSRLLHPNTKDCELAVPIMKDEVLSLGARCYSVALNIEKTNASLWHDLGVNLFLQHWVNMETIAGTCSLSEDRGTSTDILNRSISALKKSLTLDSSSYSSWNSLGIVSSFQGDYRLSQHAFICSLMLQPTAEAWSHLGALYLTHKEVHLANEAFSQAQALDPSYVTCWVGQAIVADALDHYEASDLYRHSTLLGIHPESCLGYANNILEKICRGPKKEDPKIRLTSQLPRVGDSLIFYTREKELDIVGLNMCGVAMELVGLKNTAACFYANAVKCLKNQSGVAVELRDGVAVNYGRILTALKQYDKAIKFYSQIENPDFYARCGQALAHLKGGHCETAYDKYTEALLCVSEDAAHKSDVLVALAFLQYKFRNIEEAKTLLFQSSSVPAFLALSALGLLQENATLVQAALNELKEFANSRDHVHHIAFMRAVSSSLQGDYCKATRMLLLQGDYCKATRILCHAIHSHPFNAALWRFLACHLLRMPTMSSEVAEGAKVAASATVRLSQAYGEKDRGRVDKDMLLKPMAYLKALNVAAAGQNDALPNPHLKKLRASSLNEAQRAVLMCPSQPEAWALLVAGLGDTSQSAKLAKTWSWKANPHLQAWLQSFSNRHCA